MFSPHVMPSSFVVTHWAADIISSSLSVSDTRQLKMVAAPRGHNEPAQNTDIWCHTPRHVTYVTYVHSLVSSDHVTWILAFDLSKPQNSPEVRQVLRVLTLHCRACPQCPGERIHGRHHGDHQDGDIPVTDWGGPHSNTISIWSYNLL